MCARRWLWDRVVCVQAVDPRTGAGAGALASVDVRVQRALFGAGLTPWAYYCGADAGEVLAELGRLSGGRVVVG